MQQRRSSSLSASGRDSRGNAHGGFTKTGQVETSEFDDNLSAAKKARLNMVIANATNNSRKEEKDKELKSVEEQISKIMKD